MTGGPDLSALRQSYLKVGRPLAHLPAPKVLEVWPENAPAIALWSRMHGQWLMGPGGPVSFRAEVIPEMLRRARIRRRDRQQAVNGLHVMETAALQWLDEQRRQPAPPAVPQAKRLK